MEQFHLGRVRLPRRAVYGLVPACLVAVVASAGAGGGRRPDSSALPEAVPPPLAPSAAPVVSAPGDLKRGYVKLVALRAGREPHTWSLPGRVCRSFVTDKSEQVAVTAEARIPGSPQLEADLVWEVIPPEGFAPPETPLPSGPTLQTTLTRSGGNPEGRGAPLRVTLRASVAGQPGIRPLEWVLKQDLLDRLRQEYVDLERSVVPERREFLDEAAFRRRYGKKYPAVSFADLNWSWQPASAGGGEAVRYPFILADEALVRTVHGIRGTYGPVTVSSGYRNPVRQLVVHGSVGESHHQYGRAADLQVAPDSAPPHTGRKIAIGQDWLRLAAAALRAGGSWIEPMVACHVNTDGCHVHVDVREDGPFSTVVQVTGRVTDSWGAPVAGATIRMAGMSAITNANGAYTVKHVVTAREQTLELLDGENVVLTCPVRLATDRVAVAVQLPPTGSALAASRRAEALTEASEPRPTAAGATPPTVPPSGDTATGTGSELPRPSAPGPASPTPGGAPPDAVAGAGGLAVGAVGGTAAGLLRKKQRGKESAPADRSSTGGPATGGAPPAGPAPPGSQPGAPPEK
ncbi:MAG: hypothetical protein FJX77_07915 [Armatimonadetes bacterium]|nr:hypothetical protein [Armatimonadota bacterium]